MLLEPTLRISVYDDNIKCFEIDMCTFKLVGYIIMHLVGPRVWERDQVVSYHVASFRDRIYCCVMIMMALVLNLVQRSEFYLVLDKNGDLIQFLV